jgi:hypothetical protein
VTTTKAGAPRTLVDEATFKSRLVRVKAGATREQVLEVLGQPEGMGTGFGGEPVRPGAATSGASEWWAYEVHMDAGVLRFHVVFDKAGRVIGRTRATASSTLAIRRRMGRAVPSVGRFRSASDLLDRAVAIGVGATIDEVVAMLGWPLEATLWAEGPLTGWSTSGTARDYPEHWYYSGGQGKEERRLYVLFDARGRVADKSLG